MTSDIFAVWFETFCGVKERPLLLLFDSHLTHVSVPVTERAIEEKIFILKFPPHVTDVLEPLDVACFGPLKREWEQILNLWVNKFGVKQSMRKDIFVNKILKIWYNGLNKSNITSGFEATGIFAVNSAKCPEKRFDLLLITHFNFWVANAKPESDMIALATSVEAPRKEPQTEAPKSPPKQITFNANQQTTSTPNASFQCYCMLPIPGPPSKGFVWKPRLVLVPENLDTSPQEETPPPEPALKKSFEELVLEKIKGTAHMAPTLRLIKANLTTKVIMQKEYLEAIKRAEEKKKKTKKTQLPKEVSDNECDDFFNNQDVNELSESETESEDEISNMNVIQKKFLNSPTSKDIYCWWMVCRYIQ